MIRNLNLGFHNTLFLFLGVLSLSLIFFSVVVVVESRVITENQYSIPHGIAVFKTLDEANQIHHDPQGKVSVRSASSIANEGHQFIIQPCLDEDHGIQRQTCGSPEACVSFEAKNQPNHYLKHDNGGTLKIHEANLNSKAFVQDASYCVRKANTQRVPGRVSLESVNFSGRFITFVPGQSDSLQLQEVSNHHNDIPSTWHVEYVPSSSQQNCGLLELYTPDNYPIYVEEGDSYSEMTWKAKVDGLPNGEDSKLQTGMDTYFVQKSCLAGSGDAIHCGSSFQCVSYQSVRFPNLFLMQSPDKSGLIFSDPNIEYKGAHRASFCENEPIPNVYQYGIDSSTFVKRFNYDLTMGVEASTFTKKLVACDLLPKGGVFTDKETKYEFVSWEQLPFKVELAAKSLHFTKETWNGKQWPFDETTLWTNLTPEQVAAAETLGWTANSWDDEYVSDDFNSLPDLQQRAAAVVGLDANNWNNWPTSLTEKNWEELTLQEQKAFAVFGWHKTVWDSHSNSNAQRRQLGGGGLLRGRVQDDGLQEEEGEQQ